LNVLFVTWDGVQSNYLENLFIPIFKELGKSDINFNVLQFSWSTGEQVNSNSTLCVENGMAYRHAQVQRFPSVAIGSFFTALFGKNLVKKAIDELNIDVVIARSTLPALSTMLALKGNERVKFIFEADGLPLDERVEFSNSDSTSIVSRVLRDIELQALIRSDRVITHSTSANTILHHRAGASVGIDKFYSVSNGRSSDLFNLFSNNNKITIRKEIGVEIDSPLVVFVGSLGPKYCVEEMLTLFGFIKHEMIDAKFLVVTKQEEYLSAILDKYPQLSPHIIIRTLSLSDVPSYLSACDVGLSIIKPSFSTQAVSPIKLGEYLLCGMPVIATKGIGDSSMISNSIGYLLDDTSDEELLSASNWFISKFKQKEFKKTMSRKIGIEHFSIESSVKCFQNAIGDI